MYVTCIGISRSKGVFEKDGVKYPYDNVNLHTTRENDKVSGACCEVLKAKLPLVEKAMGVSLAAGASLDSLVGVNLDIYFDRYGKVEKLEILGA